MSEAERLVREFARTYPSRNVLNALALCESGQLRWVAVAKLFARSYAEAVRELRG